MTIHLEAWSEGAFSLTPQQAASLRGTGLVKVLLGEPPDRWTLATDSRVGVARLDDGLELRVLPRLAIPKLMFLLAYAHDPTGWRGAGPAYSAEQDLFASVAAAFALHAERALARAPLQGYVSAEDQAATVRGRLRIGDQLARRPGRYLPLEITYDDYTTGIPENQLIRGAAELLLRMPMHPRRTRRRLLWIRALLEEVSAARPSPSVACPPITRLNRMYGPALALAALILRGTSISHRAGRIDGICFAFDVNRVFEDFLSSALKAALERHGGLLAAQGRQAYLDEQEKIGLIPDLTWWKQGRCHAVIDAKYKPLGDERFPNADAYQMLAYCTALGLDRGYLVYAKDFVRRVRDHTIVGAGKAIHVRAVDLEAAPEVVLMQVSALAEEIALGATRAGRRAPASGAVGRLPPRGC